jgi:hypothetical protein
MNKEDGRLTVLFDDGYVSNRSTDYAGLDLQTLIDKSVAEYGGTPLAWAPEWPYDSKSYDALLAESIAAGRTIELVDGKYIPRGLEDKPTTEPTEYAGFMFYVSPETMAANVVWSGEWVVSDFSFDEPEKVRPRLTWADSKAVDPFADYTVTSGATVDKTTQHALQRFTEGNAQVCASHALAAVRGLVKG